MKATVFNLFLIHRLAVRRTGGVGVGGAAPCVCLASFHTRLSRLSVAVVDVSRRCKCLIQSTWHRCVGLDLSQV